ncbi:YHS domain-containing protein [Desulfovermiculus halophilus]|jgi:YHS domain-containing protein|uniref:YHS domain-containing protein n=1 Tax=Desulfovermiculus halophilus TaxID=339722 RepID=UPI0004825CC4|nr:YHS domain-containing protein [Desulfovermiculus halophilus]
MFKLLIFAAAGFILYKLIMGDQKKKNLNREKKKQDLIDSGEMVKDPVCGTYVSTETGIRVKDDDQVHYFCSYQCRDAFLKNKEEETEN